MVLPGWNPVEGARFQPGSGGPVPALERRVLEIYATVVSDAMPSADDGILRNLSDDAATYSVEHEFGGTVHVELLQDVGAVRFDGRNTD